MARRPTVDGCGRIRIEPRLSLPPGAGIGPPLPQTDSPGPVRSKRGRLRVARAAAARYSTGTAPGARGAPMSEALSYAQLLANLRPTQRAVLDEYDGGRMGISAVPGID